MPHRRLVQMALQAHGFREELLGIEPQLDRLEPEDRGLVRVALGRLAAKWIGLHGPSHRVLIGEVALGDGTLRVDIHSDPGDRRPRVLGRADPPRGRASRSRPGPLDRRRESAGVWAELPRTA